MTTTENKKQRLITKAEALQRAGGISWPTAWRLIRAGKFPRPVRLGSRTMFVEIELDDHIANLPRCVYAGEAEETDANAGARRKRGGRPRKAAA